MQVEQVVAAVVEQSWGRLLALLAAPAGQVAAAEDALADAFERAVGNWNEHGVPDNPEAWLLTVARRRMIDAHRRADTAARAEPALIQLAEERAQIEPASIVDKRLELLFVCAHPAIAANVRSPLMLQTVLGLDAARIASAFLVPPTAMSQRLVRAKRKIAAAGVPFEIPERDVLPERLHAVLEAIYAAFGTPTDDGSARGLADEAIHLGRVIVHLLPDEVESLGLLSLMLHSHARRAAGNVDGRFVPLTEQDTSRWDHGLIDEADELLARASTHRHAGPFTIEALIQATHAWRRHGTDTDWPRIVSYYDTLLTIAPTVGAQVGAAAAALEADGPNVALSRLDAIEHPQVELYQPWWAVRAHALLRSGHPSANEAFRRAAGLSEDAAVRQWLLDRVV